MIFFWSDRPWRDATRRVFCVHYVFGCLVALWWSVFENLTSQAWQLILVITVVTVCDFSCGPFIWETHSCFFKHSKAFHFFADFASKILIIDNKPRVIFFKLYVLFFCPDTGMASALSFSSHCVFSLRFCISLYFRLSTLHLSCPCFFSYSSRTTCFFISYFIFLCFLILCWSSFISSSFLFYLFLISWCFSSPCDLCLIACTITAWKR